MPDAALLAGGGGHEREEEEVVVSPERLGVLNMIIKVFDCLEWFR